MQWNKSSSKLLGCPQARVCCRRSPESQECLPSTSLSSSIIGWELTMASMALTKMNWCISGAVPQTLHAHCSRRSAMYIPVAATHSTPFMHTLIWFRGVQLLEMSIGLVSAAGYFSNVNVPQRLVLHSTWKLANLFYRDWLGRGWRRALAKSVTTTLSKAA